MQNSVSKPSLLQIIRTDYISQLAVIFPAVFFALYVAVTYFGVLPDLRGRDPIMAETGAPFFFYGTLVLLIVGIPLLISRVRGINKLFSDGIAVDGQVVNARFHRGRGRIEYAYKVDGQEYTNGNAVSESARTKAIGIGAPIALLVDKSNPKRSLIRDIYA